MRKSERFSTWSRRAGQGAEQLRKFGKNMVIVDLVGISLLREIALLIVVIVIAGRSGSPLGPSPYCWGLAPF
ncbi:MAG: ABC transporter permease, partial [Nitrospiraceae bacterium]